jgi:hypothetical protein
MPEGGIQLEIGPPLVPTPSGPLAAPTLTKDYRIEPPENGARQEPLPPVRIQPAVDSVFDVELSNDDFSLNWMID